jgi:hypothetical protein
MSRTGVEDESTTQDPAIKTHRGLLNLKKFESSFQASLDEAIANFSADLLDSPVNTRQQRAVLKTLAKAFQREIKAIYKDDPDLVQQRQEQRHLTENTRKMIFGVYRADLPYYFFSKIRSIEDERWRVFFTHCILLFHNHVSIKGKKNMGLVGKIAADEVYLQKSDFDFIPVVARSHPRPRIRMSMPRPEVTKEREKVPRMNPDGSGRASRSSISKKKQ